MCPPDDVQECLWIQEATCEFWISLEQNIISSAVNEWRNCLHASVCTIGQHFDQFYCRQLKNETVGWSVSQSVKNVNKVCFCALFGLSNNTTLGKKCNISLVCFPLVVQKQTLGEVGKLQNDLMACCLRNILNKNYWNPVSFLQVTIKMFGMFFETQCIYTQSALTLHFNIMLVCYLLSCYMMMTA